MNKFIFNPIRYEEKFFWTLKEIYTEGGVSNIPDFKFGASQFSVILENMDSEGFTTSIWNNQEGFTNNYYKELADLIMKRFLNHYCFSTKSEEYDIEAGYNFIAKVVNLIEMTSPRYIKLLEVYASAKDKLLDPVKIATNHLTRFNDTPQDEGDFANDEHTTNLTEDTGETANDLDSKMGRIREIESNYNNLLLKWCNEFKGLFIEEANI